MGALSWAAVAVLALAGIYIIRLLLNGYARNAIYDSIVRKDELKKIDIENDVSITIIRKERKLNYTVKTIDYNYIFEDKKEEVFGLVLIFSKEDLTPYIGVLANISESNARNTIFILKQYKYAFDKDGRVELVDLNSINGIIEEEEINANHLHNYVNGDKVTMAILNEMLK